VRLFDTARGEIVELEPGPLVTMYSCGITPYDSAHLGHAAVYLYFDMLQRRLQDAGHETRCVRNVTDVDDDILRKAREKKLIDAGVSDLPDSEIFALIFHPGFSTADKITDVSGRGVGMDVVRKQVQKLRGRIDVISKPGEGTTFLLKLPLTLAIIDGLVVGVGDQRYIVPIFAVREMLQPAEEAISTIHGRQEMALVRGSLLPVIRLHQRFHVKPRHQQPWESLLIVAESGTKLFCLMVDELIGKQEVVIKSLGESMAHIAGVAGGAILGDDLHTFIIGLFGGVLHGMGIIAAGWEGLQVADMSGVLRRASEFHDFVTDCSGRSANLLPCETQRMGILAASQFGC